MQKRSIWRSGWLWACAAAVLIAAVGLEASGVFRPVPSAAELTRRMSDAWASVESYSALAMVGGQATAGPVGNANLRWERSGKQGVRAPDLGGFFHQEVLEGNTRLYYQPGAEVLASIEIAGLQQSPYGAWRACGYPGIHDVVRVVQEAGEVRVVGESRVDGRPTVTLAVVPHFPEELRGFQGLEREFYGARLSVPWTVDLDAATYLPVRADVEGFERSDGWSVTFRSVRLNEKLDWKLPAKENAARVRFTADLRRPETLRAAEIRLAESLRSWKERMMSQKQGGGAAAGE
ncbi:MAG: hypothetical protein ACK47B_18340 [Armatimonadota bacterium]